MAYKKFKKVNFTLRVLIHYKELTLKGGKKMKKALLIGALFSTATLTFATNGDNMIGVTPASRGMGGIGVGMPIGEIDAIFRNPAWMSTMENKFSAQFGGILFMPKVKSRQSMMFDANDNAAGNIVTFTSDQVTSASDLFVAPEIGLVHRISDQLVFGLGAFGVSGMGVDYRNEAKNFGGQPMPQLANMRTTFQFMRIIPAIAYQVNDMITVSGAIHGAWGSLDMGATMCAPVDNPQDGNPDDDGDGVPDMSMCWSAGGGQSQSIGIGAQIGASLNFGDFLYAGITYQTPVAMTYKKVFDSNGDGKFEDLKLTQPQEAALGVGAAPLDGLKLGLDVRWINWKGAQGYKDFQWEDQIVAAVGAEYKPMENLSLRLGYNYGKSPLPSGEKNGMQPKNTIPGFASNTKFTDYQIAWFNLAAFPAISEQHITLGVGYDVNENFGIEVSYVRALDKKVNACMQGNCNATYIETQMVQDSISIGANWKF